MNDDGVRGGSIAVLAVLQRTVATLEVDADDAVRISQIRLLEQIKAVAAAAQARVTAAFVASQRREQMAAGAPVERASRGVASQVALAMRVSPYRALRYCGWAAIATAELPHTFAELTAGRTTEWRAMLLARESATPTREQRTLLDAELAPRLEGLGDRAVESQARKIAYRLDPRGFTERSAAAANDRRVSLRPAPDTMAWLTTLVPVVQGVAAYAALTRAADTARATGDTRSRGQVMADTLVERLTGQASADAVPIEVTVVIDADTLLDADDQPAHLPGYGPIPAPLVRSVINDRSAPRWIRRLFTRPTDGALIRMETRRRRFTPTQARYIRLRDQTCRTPWCGAPIRHLDHIRGVEHGGPTTVVNGEGLCEACNYAKQAPGWRARPGPRGMVITTTPTGHRYSSRPPEPPGRPPRTTSPVEAHLRALLLAS